ncbi:PAS domain-containing protein [Microseira wollei]|uniref:histidine kinase n=1 Tax=Microseira wollei NIES-4236 TaxID=2530354 RepID=A0AAV3XP10_9CYAN|nr:PAS domain S-box protein [Microseira wollei]GET42870.1 multi-sensor signal transduction histidine kinase [Microseira wollei NIES-4236]
MEPVRVRNQTNLIDAGGDIGMVLQSADSTILACNPAAEQLLGYTAAQLIGTTSFDSLWQTINPDDEYPARTALLSGKPCLNVVLGFYKPNGELIWLCLSSHPLFQTDATTAYAVMTTFSAISEDELTCQKTAEQQLAEIEAIYDTAPIGLCFIDTNLRFVRINEHLAQINGIPASEHIGRTLRDILPEQADDLEPIYRQAIASGEPILNLEFRGTNRAFAGVERDWLVNLYPYRHDGRVVGVNVMVQEISERKRTEAALRASEAGYRQLVELCPDGIFIQSDGKFEFVNPAALNLFGATESEQLIGKAVMDFVHPDYREIVQLRMQQLQQNQTVPLLEEKFFRLDGTVVEVEVAAAPVVYQGKPAVQAVIRDITARKQTAAALSQSEERFRQLANAMPQMIWTTDAKGELNYVSQQWIDYSGLTLEQTREGSHATEFLHPDEIQSIQAQWSAALVSETTYQVEMRIRRASDDTYRWFLVRAIPLRDERGQVVQWYGTSTDIDARKQVEAALRQMNERFRLATLAIDGIVFEWNMLSGEVYRSEGLYQLIGVRAEDAAPTREWWMERIHPDDLARMESGMQSLESLGDRYEGEYRVRHADGRWIDVWERGCLRRDESGQIVGIETS